MSNTQKLSATRLDVENPEWTPEDMAKARPAADVLPGLIGAKAADELLRRGKGRPLKEDRKVNLFSVKYLVSFGDSYFSLFLVHCEVPESCSMSPFSFGWPVWIRCSSIP